MPNAAAVISSHGLGGWSASANPAASSSTIPKTRWCTCRPPSVSMLPGHHGTFGLRISRALVRMNRNDASSAPRTISPARVEAASRNPSPPSSSMTAASTVSPGPAGNMPPTSGWKAGRGEEYASHGRNATRSRPATHPAQPVIAATRATRSRHRAGTSARSSVYCDGLKQIVV